MKGRLSISIELAFTKGWQRIAPCTGDHLTVFKRKKGYKCMHASHDTGTIYRLNSVWIEGELRNQVWKYTAKVETNLLCPLCCRWATVTAQLDDHMTTTIPLIGMVVGFGGEHRCFRV